MYRPQQTIQNLAIGHRTMVPAEGCRGKAVIPNTLLLLPPHPLPRRPSFHPRLLRRLLVLHETTRLPSCDQRHVMKFCSCLIVRAIKTRYSSIVVNGADTHRMDRHCEAAQHLKVKTRTLLLSRTTSLARLKEVHGLKSSSPLVFSGPSGLWRRLTRDSLLHLTPDCRKMEQSHEVYYE